VRRTWPRRSPGWRLLLQAVLRERLSRTDGMKPERNLTGSLYPQSTAVDVSAKRRRRRRKQTRLSAFTSDTTFSRVHSPIRQI
jgi:hypothetical protein